MAYGCNAVMYGETFFTLTRETNLIKNAQLSHVMNSLYYGKEGNKSQSYHLCNDWIKEQPGMLRANICSNEENEFIGTTGFVGNHDVASLVFSDLEINDQLEQQAKDFIQGIAFGSDSGWCLLAGDEFLAEMRVPRGIPITFDIQHLQAAPNYLPRADLSFYHNLLETWQKFDEHWKGRHDLMIFITRVNLILADLPALKRFDYTTRHRIDDLTFTARYSKAAYNGTPKVSVICTNIGSQVVNNEIFLTAYENVKTQIIGQEDPNLFDFYCFYFIDDDRVCKKLETASDVVVLEEQANKVISSIPPEIEYLIGQPIEHHHPSLLSAVLKAYGPGAEVKWQSAIPEIMPVIEKNNDTPLIELLSEKLARHIVLFQEDGTFIETFDELDPQSTLFIYQANGKYGTMQLIDEATIDEALSSIRCTSNNLSI